MPLLEITFSLNVGQFISLPILLALVAAMVWLKRQVGPLTIKVGEIATNIQAAVDERFNTVTIAATENQRLLQAQYETVLKAVNDLIKEMAGLSEHMKVANGHAAEHSAEDIRRFGEIAIHLSNIEGRLGLPHQNKENL